MMNFKQNEDAVSPVIGVILMVAITVILAAVIAAFVFGMTGNVQTTKTVAVTANLDKDGLLAVTLQGSSDVADLKSLSMTVNGGEPLVVDADSTPALGVGASFKTTDAIKSGDHVIIVALFKDNSEQVILDKFY
jgi:flagellin-like protein